MREENGRVGVADHPDSSAVTNGSAARAGADSAPLPDEGPAEHIRNALQILIAGQESILSLYPSPTTVKDVRAMRARLEEALRLIEAPISDADGIDNLLRQYERACAAVVEQGESNLSATTKERAIFRNAVRAQLLAAKGKPTR